LQEGLRFRESVKISPEVDAHRFSGDRSALVAICSPDVDKLLTVEHQGLGRIVDTMGTSLPVDAASGSLTIPLEAGFPLYLQGRPDLKVNAKVSPRPLVPAQRYIHPGDTLKVHANSGVEVVDWQMPAGWQMPVRNGAGVYEVKVPDVAISGPVELIARLRGGVLPRMPLRFSVEPRLLRL
jgi:hypothetical protein